MAAPASKSATPIKDAACPGALGAPEHWRTAEPHRHPHVGYNLVDGVPLVIAVTDGRSECNRMPEQEQPTEAPNAGRGGAGDC